MTGQFIEVPGGRLRVIDEGRGSPVVLVHAGIADLRSWDPVASLLVEAGLRTIRYDLRGHGLSETADVAFSNRDDLIAVLDAVGVDRAVVVGSSAGGQIALDTAVERPDRVAAVVGVAAGLGGFEPDITPEELALFEAMDRLESADEPDADAIADFDVRLWVDGPGQPPDRVPSAIRELVREMDRPLYAAGRVRGRPIPLRPPAADRLSALRCPVLAIAGSLDVSDAIATARHLEANAPDARAIVIPGVAHMVGLEVPDLLARTIVDFVAGLGGDRRAGGGSR